MLVRILVVDDEPNMLEVVRGALSRDEFRIDGVRTASDALDFVSRRPPDLMILDYNLPDRPGTQVCRIVRNDPKTSSIAVIMLTVVKELKEKVDALELGADDYLTKPFHVSELRARVHSVLRRRTPWLVPTQVLEFKELTLDPGGMKALVQKRAVPLTRVEFEILYVLALNAGRVVQRAYIESRVLDMDSPTDSRPLDVHLSHLREKLGARSASRIETVRGLGYLFNGDPR